MKPNGFARFALSTSVAVTLLAAATACEKGAGDPPTDTPDQAESSAPADDTQAETGGMPTQGAIGSVLTDSCLQTDELERGPDWIMTVLKSGASCESAPVFEFRELSGGAGYQILLDGSCLGIDDDDAGPNNGRPFVLEGDGECALWEPTAVSSGTWTLTLTAEEEGSCLHLATSGSAEIAPCGDSEGHLWEIPAA